MSSSSDVLVVSLAGKGHYIASLLSQKGHSVTLLNLSINNLNLEDLIGPFDFFENLTDPLQEAFLNSFIHFQKAPSGFTLWTTSGPIDFQSFIKNYSLEQEGLDADNIEYLSNVNLLSSEERKTLRFNLSKLPHSENWLSKLAHQLPSSRFQLKSYNLETTETKALPFFNKKKIAHPAHNSLDNSLHWCKKNKVTVINIDNILSINSNSITYINSETKQTDKLAAKKFIWTLNSQETQHFFPKIFSKLYKKLLIPLWKWTKISLQLSENNIPNFNNHSFIMLNKPELNFGGDNLGIIKKTNLPNVWNLWLSVPQKTPKQERINRASVNFFIKRIPQLKIIKSSVSSNNAPPLYPVFDALKTGHTHTINNFYFCNFEVCPNLDWHNFLNFQKNISKKICKQLSQGSSI